MNFEQFSPRSIIVKNIVSSPVHKMEVSYQPKLQYLSQQPSKEWIERNLTPFHKSFAFTSAYLCEKTKLKPYVQS